MQDDTPLEQGGRNLVKLMGKGPLYRLKKETRKCLRALARDINYEDLPFRFKVRRQLGPQLAEEATSSSAADVVDTAHPAELTPDTASAHERVADTKRAAAMLAVASVVEQVLLPTAAQLKATLTYYLITLIVLLFYIYIYISEA